MPHETTPVRIQGWTDPDFSFSSVWSRQTRGPPESPAQASLPPSRWPAQSMLAVTCENNNEKLDGPVFFWFEHFLEGFEHFWHFGNRNIGKTLLDKTMHFVCNKYSRYKICLISNLLRSDDRLPSYRQKGKICHHIIEPENAILNRIFIDSLKLFVDYSVACCHI